MFIDASAVLAILLREPEAEFFIGRIEAAKLRVVSGVVLFETVAGLARVREIPVEDAQAITDDFVRESRAQVAAIDAAVGRYAIDAFNLFGKGRHPARLNMGDCFAYACAKAHRLPLLFKGDDFSQTDIDSAAAR